jgi:hypothetical protein
MIYGYKETQLCALRPMESVLNGTMKSCPGLNKEVDAQTQEIIEGAGTI